MSQNTPEGKVKKALDQEIKRLQDEYPQKIWYHSPQAGPFGRAGVPDRIGCVAGCFFAVECKANSHMQPTPLQTRESIAIIRAGGAYFLVNDITYKVDAVVRWIIAKLTLEILTNDQSNS